MIKVGCAHVSDIEALDGCEKDGVKFEMVSKKGIQVTFKHNAESDAKAKSIFKKIIAEHSEFDAMFVSIQI